jgi:hypothetical protein
VKNGTATSRIRAVPLRPLAACVVASALAFVWGHRLVPLQDYPDWVLQGKLLADLLDGRLADSYKFVSGFVPNSASTVLIGLLARWVDPEIAGKLLLSAQLIAHVASALYLLTALGQPRTLALPAAALVLVFNYSFLHGNINYVLALAVLFWGQGLALRRFDVFDRKTCVGLAEVSLTIYFCHGAAYVAWLVFLGVLALVSGTRRTALRLTLVLAPSLVAAVAYALGRGVGPGGASTQWHAYASLPTLLGDKLWTLIKFACPFQGLYPYLNPALAWTFAAANLLVLAICVAALVRLWKLARARERPADSRLRVIGWTILAYFALFCLAPRSIGGLINPSERMLLPAFYLLLTASVALAPAVLPARARVASVAAACMLALQALYLHAYAGGVAERLQSAFDRIAPYTRDAGLVTLHESHFKFEGRPHPERPLSWSLLPLHYPMLRLTYYAELSRDRPVPIFDTGLFRSELRPVPNDVSFASSLAQRTVVIVGRPEGSEAIVAALKVPVTRLADDGLSYLVLALGGAPESPAAPGYRGQVEPQH